MHVGRAEEVTARGERERVRPLSCLRAPLSRQVQGQSSYATSAAAALAYRCYVHAIALRVGRDVAYAGEGGRRDNLKPLSLTLSLPQYKQRAAAAAIALGSLDAAEKKGGKSRDDASFFIVRVLYL